MWGNAAKLTNQAVAGFQDGSRVMTDVARHERQSPTQPVRVHPAALAFPELSPAALHELAEDIRRNGLVHPITRTADGIVLDGATRLKACEIAGVEPRFEIYMGSDPVGFIVSSNLKRRQLNESQRALIATPACNAGPRATSGRRPRTRSNPNRP